MSDPVTPDRQTIETAEPSVTVGREDFGVLARWVKVDDIGGRPAYEARVRSDVPAISVRAHEAEVDRLVAEAVAAERELLRLIVDAYDAWLDAPAGFGPTATEADRVARRHLGDVIGLAEGHLAALPESEKG